MSFDFGTFHFQIVRTTRYTWDAEDHLTAWTDTDHSRSQSTSAQLSYDAAGRKTSETITYPGISGNASIAGLGAGSTLGYSMAYSPGGKPTRLTLPDGSALDYAYSAHGELQSVSIPGEGSISVNQYKWTEPSKTTLPGGVTQNRSLDGLLQLQDLQVNTPGQQTLLQVTNTWGKVQDLQAQSRTDTANAVSSTTSRNFAYDDEVRLTRVQTTAPSSDTQTYTLDALGNRIAHSRISGAWTYDANNRLTQRGSGAGATSYQYDNAGNLTQKLEAGATTTYRYDTQNRLIEVALAQSVGIEQVIARYGYDPQDRRIWKEQYASKTGEPLLIAQRTLYLYSDQGLLAEAAQTFSSADASIITVPTITTQYGLRPDSPWGTAPLFIQTKNSAGQTSMAYYHHDQLGTPLQATDKAGNIVWAASFDAFGRASITTPQATVDKPTIASNLRLPGQYEDVETGLHYNFRRYYDPEIGRYVSQDPIGVEGGLNLYQYAYADPVNSQDPTGECPWCAAYAVCVAECALTTAAVNAVTGECNNWGDTAKECAVECAIGFGMGWAAKKFRNWARDAASCGLSSGDNSFPGDTVVHVKPPAASPQDATQAKAERKPISQIKVGDEVLALSEWMAKGAVKGQDQRLSYEKVTDVITSLKEQTLVHLKLANGETLTATEGHPFKTTLGWRDAILLKKGGKLLLKGGDTDTEPSIKIIDVRTERKTLPVFNIEVANAHTFFIGVDGEVVHNAICGSGKPPIGKRNNYSSKKDAYEAAKRAGRDKEPIHHANGHPSNPTPHYHPNVKDPKDWTPKVPREHDHYFYP